MADNDSCQPVLVNILKQVLYLVWDLTVYTHVRCWYAVYAFLNQQFFVTCF